MSFWRGVGECCLETVGDTDGSHSTQLFLSSSVKGLPLSIPTLKGSVREQVDDLDALEHPVTPVLRRFEAV